MSGNIRRAPATRLLLCISILIFSGCSQTVQPLGYGSVSCSYCKMQLEDRRFGGEIVTRYGRIYQFDDEPCLVHFMKSLSTQLKLKAKIYVADAAHNGKLIPAETATYFCTDQLVSPMNGNTMAFSNKAEMQIMIENLPGKVSQWSDILQKF